LPEQRIDASSVTIRPIRQDSAQREVSAGIIIMVLARIATVEQRTKLSSVSRRASMVQQFVITPTCRVS
jgi:hypothetical protein